MKTLSFPLWPLLVLVCLLTACGGGSSDSGGSSSDNGSQSSDQSSEQSSSQSSSTEAEVLPDIPADTLRVHYQRTDNTYGNMGLWLWGAVETPSEAVASWPVGATSFPEEQTSLYGAYVDIKLSSEQYPNRVYFLVIDTTTGDGDAGQKEVVLTTPDMNEIWIKEGSDDVLLWEPVDLPDNTIRIHYERVDQDYGDWGLWLWGDVATASEEIASWPTGASAFSNTQVGRHGAYIDILYKENANSISFIIVNRTDGSQQDGDARFFARLNDYDQLFLKEGNLGVFTSPYVSDAGESTAYFPEWSKDSTIYEVNVRQYTPEGTFNAFATHLPRLQDLGVEILWFMPIHPISVEGRLGTLGSYYAVADFKAVNPEFGTLEDFKALVETAQDMGFKVILDWVANHTGWDNAWIHNPGWYNTDEAGNIVSTYNWFDTAELNYDNADMRAAMLDALKFWVTEANVDGYRADYATGVPQDFWEAVREELDAIKPVYMLAEDNSQYSLLLEAFNANYGWELYYNVMEGIPSGAKGANDIKDYIDRTQQLYPAGSYPMTFITNHDINSWEGTTQEILGDAEQAMAALMFTLPGMPLIYSGQEAGLNKRLAFFDKDEIDWSDLSMQVFYESLIRLKKENQALWNGSAGGDVTFLEVNDQRVVAFEREKDGNRVISIFNLSADQVTATVTVGESAGSYRPYLEGSSTEFSEEQTFELAPWGFEIFTNDEMENSVPVENYPTTLNGNTTVPVAEATGGVKVLKAA